MEFLGECDSYEGRRIVAYKDDKHISLAVGDHRQRDSFDPLLVNSSNGSRP